jgi:formylglycine-generating enzyme required for sulfatase activity
MPFSIGRYEVTFDQYSAFAFAEAERKVPIDQNLGRGNHPVIHVSWDDARAYIEWLNGHLPIWRPGTPVRYRLPSESEWEYASRGGTNTDYWWGKQHNEDDGVWANCHGCGSQWDGNRTAPVGRFPANPFGLYDTAGNVWEWVQDCWHGSYDGVARPDDGAPWEAEDGGECDRRVVRGGSWNDVPGTLRSANRSGLIRFFGTYNVGFRLAQSARANLP